MKISLVNFWNCLKLVETYNPNVDIVYKTVNYKTEPNFKVRMKHLQFNTMLMVELEMKIKAKKQVVEKLNIAYGPSTDNKSNDEMT